MAIYGIGAWYDDWGDVSQEFINKNLACVGWSEAEAPPLFVILKHFKIGDVIYIKAHPRSVGLIVKAVGIVVSDRLKNDKRLGTGVPVEWVWTGTERMGKLADKYPVRSITLFQEFNPLVQKKVVKLLLSCVKSAPRRVFLVPNKSKHG